MMRTFLTATLAIVSILGMTPAYAQYISPEDMLYQQGYAYPEDVFTANDSAFLVPSHKRGAQWSADLQAQQSAERHVPIIRDPWDPDPNQGIPPAPVPPVVYYQPQPEQQPIPNQGLGSLDPITARLLERLSRDNVIHTTVNPGYLPSTAGYAGVPLAHTGPEAVLIAIAMIAAVLWTLRRARGLERFVR